MKYYYDNKRHLICIPYSISNLHRMADDLNIGRQWFHSKEKLSHYDIPKSKIEEVFLKAIKISSRELVKLILNSSPCFYID